MNYEDWMDWALKGLVAAAFMTWAWVVKNFGSQHIVTLGKLERDIATLNSHLVDMKIELIKEVADLKSKVSVLEARMGEK